MRKALVLGCLFLVLCSSALKAETMSFVYPPPEAAGDERHLYYWQLLDAALASNRDKYGDYATAAYSDPMTFQRAAAEVA